MQAGIEEKRMDFYSGSTELKERAHEDLEELGVLEPYGDHPPRFKPYFKNLIDLTNFDPETFPTIGAVAEGTLINSRGDDLEKEQFSHRFDDDDALELPPELLS